MQERLADLNRRSAAAGRPPFAASVGIHSGEVLAGTIGAEDRHEYTVIGDAVNVAARLQELATEQGRALLVSEATHALAGGDAAADALVRLQTVTLRGRRETVAIYGLA